MTTYREALKIVNQKIQKDQEKREKKDKSEGKKLIGNFYKFRNSYGNPDEGWWLYIEISHLEDTSLVVREYQITSHDKAEIKEQVLWPSNYLSPTYIKISKEEFEKGRDEVLNKLQLVHMDDV